MGVTDTRTESSKAVDCETRHRDCLQNTAVGRQWDWREGGQGWGAGGCDIEEHMGPKQVQSPLDFEAPEESPSALSLRPGVAATFSEPKAGVSAVVAPAAPLAADAGPCPAVSLRPLNPVCLQSRQAGFCSCAILRKLVGLPHDSWGPGHQTTGSASSLPWGSTCCPLTASVSHMHEPSAEEGAATPSALFPECTIRAGSSRPRPSWLAT